LHLPLVCRRAADEGESRTQPQGRGVNEIEHGMQIYLSILGVIAVWRVTHLLAFEDGPGLVFKRLRKRAERTFWGEVFECFYCLSLWVAAPFALLAMEGWREYALLWPALSGGAILLERLSAGEPTVAAGYYVEDQEKRTEAEDEDVLR